MKNKKFINLNFNIQWLFSFVSVVFTALYMPIFQWATNSREVNISEAVLPMGIFIVIALVIFFLSLLIFRSSTKASLICIVFVLLLENYHYFEKGIQRYMPQAKYWHILPVCVFICLHLCYLICTMLKEDTRKTVNNIVGIVMGALILINIFCSIPNVISKGKVIQSNNEILNIEGSNHDGANIYYFLLDEAAPFNVMETVYNSDMSEFRDFFLDNHFIVSENSYNEERTTGVVLTNLLNLKYIANQSMSDEQLGELRKDASLFHVLEESEYSLYGVGDTAWLSIESLTANKEIAAKSIDGKSFEQMVMDTTFLYPFFDKNYSEEQELIFNTFEYFYEDIYDTNSEFKFAYIQCPHVPFLFDENGKPNAESNYLNWEDKQYYLGQYKFMLKKVQDVVARIIEQDPNSIIIVASDHGVRGLEEVSIEKQKNILNAVYFKGEKIEELRDLSSVNTLRGILSKQLNIELPLVEVPCGE